MLQAAGPCSALEALMGLGPKVGWVKWGRWEETGGPHCLEVQKSSKGSPIDQHGLYRTLGEGRGEG